MTDSLALIAGYASVILTIISWGIYWRDVLHKGVRPHRTTLLIWALLGWIFVANNLASGATTSLPYLIAFAVLPTIGFVASYWKGEGGLSRFDLTCLGGALLGLVLWWIFDDPTLSIICNIAVDALGSLPTILKSWRRPRSESLPSWLLQYLVNICGLLSVGSLVPSLIALPVYNLLLGTAVTTGLIYGRIHERRHTYQPATMSS